MEVPEKIYIDDPTGEFNDSWSIYKNNISIEYTRTDVIVKEICEWLKTNYTEFLDNSRLGINIEELVKDLRNDFKNRISYGNTREDLYA